MPVYNEQDCIVEVIESWKSELAKLGLKYRLIAINDGSKDQTAERLVAFENDPCVKVINKQNQGHGPTILMGYRQAVELAPWVFQVDSDDEIVAAEFGKFWQMRDDFDGLFGIRTNRHQEWDRRLISFGSRQVIASLFSRNVSDVNVPYRLMRSRVLRKILEPIPDDTFAPNILISGGFSKLRVANIEVEHRMRQTGTVSIANTRLWKAAVRSLFQTMNTSVSISRIKFDADVR